MRRDVLLKGCFVGLAFLLVIAPDVALAAQTGSAPWDSGMSKLANSLSSSVAWNVAVIGVTGACMVALLSGADLTGWVKTTAQIGFVIGALLSVVSLVTWFTGIGAMVV